MLVLIGADYIGSCKFNYHIIMNMTTPFYSYKNHSNLIITILLVNVLLDISS